MSQIFNKMSGYKHSEFKLEAKRQKRMDLITEISTAQKECDGLKKSITKTLKDFSNGLKTTFHGDFAAAEEWLKRNFDKYKDVNADNDLDYLERLKNEISNIKKEGDFILDKLNENLMQKAPEMERKLKEEYSVIERRIVGYRDMLVIWFGEEHVKSIENRIEKIQKFINEKDYNKADSLITKLNNEFNSDLNEAKDLEAKHQKRLHVLKCLRMVSHELGFNETELRFEKPENEPIYKRSRIIYEVDTYDRGKIKFYISMDNIDTHSGIVENECMDYFDKISEKLKEEFGINTKFKMLDEKPREKFKRKGELDEPTGARTQAEDG